MPIAFFTLINLGDQNNTEAGGGPRFEVGSQRGRPAVKLVLMTNQGWCEAAGTLRGLNLEPGSCEREESKLAPLCPLVSFEMALLKQFQLVEGAKP